MGKQAVIFGAGNIGRGLVGLLLKEVGYRITFVDVNGALVEALNEAKGYTAILHAADSERLVRVNGLRALHGEAVPEVARAVAEADLVCTALGVNVLPKIAPTLVAGLQSRKQAGVPQALTIIACENVQGNSMLLRRAVVAAAGTGWSSLAMSVVFADCLVDRIVPNASPTHAAVYPLDVHAEAYYEFMVDRTVFRDGEAPEVPGWTYTDRLSAEFTRKLYLVNGLHVAIAYLGQRAGAATIHEALRKPDITVEIREVRDEIVHALVAAHGFERNDVLRRSERVLKRFENSSLADPVTRVGRNPKRKLGSSERILGSMADAYAHGLEPTHLARVAAAAFAFTAPDDVEAAEIAALVADGGLASAVGTVTGLGDDDPLVRLIVASV